MTLTLGPDWQRDLWTSPNRLRFELNGVGAFVNMFTTSYDRARSLARAALPNDDFIAIIAAFPEPQKELGAEQFGWMNGNGFDLLNELGVPTGAAIATWDAFCWPGDEDDDGAKPWAHRAISLTWDKADILIWNQLAQDIGVAPKAPVKSKLVDLKRGVSVDPYDDRGMDIMALSKDPIADLYEQFGSWLLDHDRNRMSEVFDR